MLHCSSCEALGAVSKLKNILTELTNRKHHVNGSSLSRGFTGRGSTPPEAVGWGFKILQLTIRKYYC